MNNIITKTESSLKFKINPDNPAVDLLSLFAAYTPQFYNTASYEKKRIETNKIKHVINNLEYDVIQKMAELSLSNYLEEIAVDKSTRFNLDYFSRSLKQALEIIYPDLPNGIFYLDSYKIEGLIFTQVYCEIDDIENSIPIKTYIIKRLLNKSPAP